MIYIINIREEYSSAAIRQFDARAFSYDALTIDMGGRSTPQHFH